MFIPQGQLWFKKKIEALGYKLQHGFCHGISQVAIKQFLSGNIKSFIYLCNALHNMSIKDLKMINLKPSTIIGKISGDTIHAYDLIALLDEIVLYQTPLEYAYVFDEHCRLSQQQAPVKDLFYPLYSDEGSKKSIPIKHYDGLGIFNLEKIKQYISILQSNLSKPTSLLTSSDLHSIALNYIPDKNQWILINIDKFSHKYYSNTEELALAIQQAFIDKSSQNKDITLNTSLFTNHTNNKDITSLLEDEAWKSLHGIKAKINQQDCLGVSRLHCAAKCGNIEAVNALIGKGAKIDIVNHKKETPLMNAAYSGFHEIAEILINAKADINLKDAYGNTPLHLAIDNRNTEIVNLLLENKAVLESCDANGDTPVMRAVANGLIDLFFLLKKYGANLNHINNQGDSLLDAALSYDNLTESSQSMTLVKVLIENGLDIDAKNEAGQTKLFSAILNNRLEEATIRLSLGSQVNHTDKYGATPLHMAALAGNTETAKLLLDNGANIEACDTKGDTPIMRAVASGHIDLFFLLKKYGANLNHINKHGDSLLDAAFSNDNLTINGHSMTLAKALIENGLDIDAKNEAGQTKLFGAILNNRLEEAKARLSLGSQVNHKDKYGAIPLHMAALAGNTETAKLLLDNGANIEACDTNGHTPVDLAFMHKNIDFIKLLIDKNIIRNNEIIQNNIFKTDWNCSFFNGYKVSLNDKGAIKYKTTVPTLQKKILDLINNEIKKINKGKTPQWCKLLKAVKTVQASQSSFRDFRDRVKERKDSTTQEKLNKCRATFS